MKEHFFTTHFLKVITHYIVLSALVLTLVLAITTFAVPQAHAASYKHTNPARSTVPLGPAMKIWTNSAYNPTTYGAQTTLELDWTGGGGCCLGFTVYFEPGTTDTYQCILSCSTGATGFFHIWTQRGRFNITCDSNQGGSCAGYTQTVN